MKYIDQFLKILSETDYNALVRKEWFLFCTINIFVPFLMKGFLSSLFPFWRITFFVSVAFVILIIAANYYRIKRTQNLKKTYCLFAFLNPLSFIVTGGISFSESLFSWPLATQSYYATIRGHETIIPFY